MQPLAPYLNPPAAARARGLIMSDPQGEVQVIAPEGALVDVHALQAQTQRPLRPLTYDPGTPTSAVPGAYDMPVLVDQALVSQADVALATAEPGGYVKVSGADLGSTLVGSKRETQVLAFSHPLQVEPTEGGADNDRARIEASVTDLTELRIQERLDTTLQIPPLPEMARRIIALRADPDFKIADLVSIIETDPSIAARIMGWANSAFYNVDPPARSIADAVMRVLGFDTASSMALGLALGETLRLPDAHVHGLPPFWLDAVFTAATMESLARLIPKSQQPTVGLCYMAGLLANFGTLVLGHVFPPHYEKICALQDANRHVPHTYVDQHVIKLPREILASALLEGWGLPEPVTDAVRYQYATDYVGANGSYVYLLQVARQALGAQGLTDAPGTEIDDATLAQLSLSAEDLDQVIQRVNASADELDSVAKAYG